ncbi:MAG TPA: hypothetical protein DCZ91_00290 [Lachnospiraceae bacterium]|nr:hypothetical protein [Lachnospiraceae bacterium]
MQKLHFELHFGRTGSITNPSNGMSDLKVHVFGARVESEAAEFDENEVQGKKWIPKNEVLDMLRANEIQCGVSMLALLYAVNFYLL